MRFTDEYSLFEAKAYDRKVSEEEARIADELAASAKYLMRERVVRLERFRLVLDVEIGNLLRRAGLDGVRQAEPAQWLREKRLDKTYHYDNTKRIHDLLTAWMLWFGGDEKLLMSEIARMLSFKFPIKGNSYEWFPKLLRSKDNRLNLQFTQRRKRKASTTANEQSSPISASILIIER